jgi:hypothetical protein
MLEWRVGSSWQQVMALRLGRHQLRERAAPEREAEVVGAIGGLHAQLFSAAELSLWNRVDGLAAGDLERRLWTDRAYVKTWAMRGTLHLLPAARYPTLQSGWSTYEHYLKPVWLRNFGVTRDELELLVDTVGVALDGPPLARAELADEVARRTGSGPLAEKIRESWGAPLKPASFRGRLCFAPNAGQNVRFTRPDRWLGDFDPVEPGAALADITRRYLAAPGPGDPGGPRPLVGRHPGLDLAGAAGERPDGRGVAARALGRPDRGADRTVRPGTSVGAARGGAGGRAARGLPRRHAGRAVGVNTVCRAAGSG